MDAIAAGGGLAGTAFALELARHGANAMIIERTAGPHHKVCGDFLTDKAKGLLQHLGLDTGKLGGSRIDTLGLADKASEAKAPLPPVESHGDTLRYDTVHCPPAEKSWKWMHNPG